MRPLPAHYSDDSVEVRPVSAPLAYGPLPAHELLDGGEIIILAVKPSVWHLGLIAARWLLAAALIILLAPATAGLLPAFPAGQATQIALVITALRLLAALLLWSSRLYVLTNRRVMRYSGVFQIAIFETPLVNIRNTYLKSGRVERLCRIGSIGFSLRGSKRVDAWWEQISNPIETHERIRRAIEKAIDNHAPY